MTSPFLPDDVRAGVRQGVRLCKESLNRESQRVEVPIQNCQDPRQVDDVVGMNEDISLTLDPFPRNLWSVTPGLLGHTGHCFSDDHQLVLDRIDPHVW